MEPEGDKTQSHEILAKDTTVGHYRIVEKIGAGGMGEVYLAEDTQLKRKVALKFLSSHLCRDDDCRRRFTREAQAAAGLDHPNIAGIYEIGEYSGRPFYSMQVVEGQSLREMIADKSLPIDRILEIAMQVCEGLQAAHNELIIHRDIKPSNILIDGHGRVRIVDFGLAAVRGSEHLTKTGSTLGTIGYMSPEQIQGQDADHRSDLFSLGVVLYELIAGRLPFKGDTEAAVLNSVLNEIPEPLSRYKSGVSGKLQDIVSKLLEKDPPLRYQSAAGLISDLKTFARDRLSDSGAHVSQPSIAVLPFTNLSADPEQEYFCDGIAEEIINVLAQIEDMKVVARTSCFAFKGKVEDVREIGRKLDVNHVLEGSVRKAGKRIRITSQLINVADGYHLWSEKFDRELEDIFAIQDEISTAIADRLKLKLVSTPKKTASRRYTENVEAYTLYLKGRYYWNKRTADNLDQAITYFQQGIDLDPDYALAYAGLADCYNMMAQAWALPPKAAFPKAKAAALKALALDNELAEAKAALALLTSWYEWDFPAAETLFKEAIQFNPNYAPARQWYAFCLTEMNRPQEAMNEMNKARGLDPLSTIFKLETCWLLATNGQIAAAEEECRQALKLDPHFAPAYEVLGWHLEMQGNYKEAFEMYMHTRAFYATHAPEQRNELDQAFAKSGWPGFLKARINQLIKRAQESYVPASEIAKLYTGLGDKDEAFAWLDKARMDRDIHMSSLRSDPSFAPLRSDNRFASLIEKMGIRYSR